MRRVAEIVWTLMAVMACFVAPPTLATRITGSPWLSPCSVGSRVEAHERVSFDFGTPDLTTSLPGFVHEMRVETRRARDSARRLYQYILTERLPNLLQGECEDGASLQGIPEVESRPASARNRLTTLPEDFRHLAELTVFVQEAATDNISYNYNRQMERLWRRLVRLMCSVETISLTMGMTIPRDVTHDVMLNRYMNLRDQGQRDRRNCLIVRDTFNILDSLHRWY